MMERALTTAGIAVVTATTDHGRRAGDPMTEDILWHGGIITRFYAPKAANFYKVAPALIPWLWRNVASFDAVHIHALFSFSSIAAGVIAWVRGVPYVIRPLGTLTAYGMTQRASLKKVSLALIEKPILRRAAAVHFTSKQEADEARALNITMRETLIPLGVEETADGIAERIEDEYPTLKGHNVILFLSRLDPKKNLETLLEAFSLSADLKSSAVLAVAGSGEAEYVLRLKERAHRLGISDRILWLGHLDGERKADALARADIFVLPSYSENFGIAAVEAMLAGLPCVLGEGVAVAKPADAEEAAIAVAPVPEAVARALERLLADPVLRARMGATARAHAQRCYSLDTMAECLKELYANLNASPGGTAR
jgi:glycosyltransferase involved in cell wall biosynthesis